MLLRPFNTLIALFVVVVTFLAFSILYSSNSSTEEVVHFSSSYSPTKVSESRFEKPVADVKVSPVAAEDVASSSVIATAEQVAAQPVSNEVDSSASSASSLVESSKPVVNSETVDQHTYSENSPAAPESAYPPHAQKITDPVSEDNSMNTQIGENNVAEAFSDTIPKKQALTEEKEDAIEGVGENDGQSSTDPVALNDAITTTTATTTASTTSTPENSENSENDTDQSVIDSKDEVLKSTFADAEEIVTQKKAEADRKAAEDQRKADLAAEEEQKAAEEKKADEKKKAAEQSAALAAYAAAEKAYKDRQAAREKAAQAKIASEAAASSKDEDSSVADAVVYRPPIPKGDLPNPLRIFLTENGGSHEEVFAALIYAFAQLPNSYIYQYLFAPRFNIFAVLKTFNLRNLAKPRGSTSMKFDKMNPIPDIILGTTCEFDIRRLKNQMKVARDAGSYLFCTVHHGDRWHKDSFYHFYDDIIPWIESKRISFVFLSGHTKRFMEENIIPSWAPEHRDIKSNFRVLVPVFPVPIENKKELSFSLQGNYESERRDYAAIFKQFESFTQNAPENSNLQKLRIHLIGHGKHPEVPPAIKDRVEFNEGLEFAEFYKILSDSFALLPAFASDEYYDRKASSSVPASLIAGVPIVGKRRLLQTYDYLTEDSIWLQQDNEGDLDVIGRILELGEDKIAEQKARTNARNKEVVQENIGKALTWSKEIEYKVQRTGKEVVKAGWTWDW
ncbi:hypothetical protein V1514DRAFT_229753 [Lipomyces japonicus]|uniref:uncharacterized protein n=1 Tax=Lipomyces japonicus TaxID=56871 RepID=UPI0034CFC66E